MRVTSRIFLMLFMAVFLSQSKSAELSGTNGTTTSSSLDDEEVESLEKMDLAEFKERYRRLIPYMPYYLASNYVGSQVSGGANHHHYHQQQQQQQQQSYERETALPTSPLIRKPQRLVALGRPIDFRAKPNSAHRVSSLLPTKQEDKFVPSIQYDPKDIGGDTDYFTPVKYATKLPSLDYTAVPAGNQYERSKPRPQLYPEITSSHSATSNREHYAKNRPPLRASINVHSRTALRNYLPNKPKASASNFHQNYQLDYGSRVTSNKGSFGSADYVYPIEDFEGIRYVSVEPPLRTVAPKPTRILAQSPEPFYVSRNPGFNLEDIMKSLQLTNRLPEMLNRDNIDSSIKTLVEILGILNNAKQTEFTKYSDNQLITEPLRNSANYELKDDNRPKIVTETRYEATPSPELVDEIPYQPENSYETNYETPENLKYHNNVEYYTPLVQDIEDTEKGKYVTSDRPTKIHDSNSYDSVEDSDDKYNLPITTTATVGKFRAPEGASNRLSPPTTLKYGATRGKANVDYPAYAAIPETDFNCKEQRYKGFFGDPSTGCQVWHYCDLNGGKSSFLCPNGTIFSQVALTCDWWFNVKCESTAQLYVLNERLYKYIIPVMPKFPEDFSGPEVDRYLELKFKEMEDKLKAKKLKKQKDKDATKEKLQSLETDE